MSFIPGLPVSSARAETLMADFSGLVDLEKIVKDALQKLFLRDNIQQQAQWVKTGAMSKESFDIMFAELVRVELGKTLGIIRNKAIAKARAAGAGSAATAVYRRMYKGDYMGNVNIAGNRGRISNKKRQVQQPMGGRSGIRRNRTLRGRTKQINEYYGPDRHFILRFLNEGTDTRTATPEGPTGRGSKATYGNRASISPKGFFHQMHSDMEQAAQQLGETLINHVEKWVNQEFKETE